MTSTFLVTLDVPSSDPSSLQGLAEEIQDSLETDGLPVVSVAPWARQDLPKPQQDAPDMYGTSLS